MSQNISVCEAYNLLQNGNYVSKFPAFSTKINTDDGKRIWCGNASTTDGDPTMLKDAANAWTCNRQDGNKVLSTDPQKSGDLNLGFLVRSSSDDATYNTCAKWTGTGNEDAKIGFLCGRQCRQEVYDDYDNTGVINTDYRSPCDIGVDILNSNGNELNYSDYTCDGMYSPSELGANNASVPQLKELGFTDDDLAKLDPNALYTVCKRKMDAWNVDDRKNCCLGFNGFTTTEKCNPEWCPNNTECATFLQENGYGCGQDSHCPDGQVCQGFDANGVAGVCTSGSPTPSSTPPSTESPTTEKGNRTPIIVGAVVGGLGFIGLIIFLIIMNVTMK